MVRKFNIPLDIILLTAQGIAAMVRPSWEIVGAYLVTSAMIFSGRYIALKASKDEIMKRLEEVEKNLSNVRSSIALKR